MIAVKTYKGKKVAVFGLGGSGIATAQALMLGGADVVAFDDNKNSVAAAQAKDIPIQDLHEIDWSKITSLILAPGVPLTNPEPHWSVKLAKAANVEIIGDIELFIRERSQIMQDEGVGEKDMPLIAITGTNGKSTTTALIAHILQKSGIDVQMGGNIGKAILSLESLERGRYYVIEMSSFQIDLTPSLKPTIGILLNLTPDHIDRHGSFEHYSALKQRLVANAKTALIAVDDDFCLEIYKKLHKKHENIIAISKDKQYEYCAYFAKDNMLYSQHNGNVEKRLNLAGIDSLRGSHNAQNALLALACFDVLKINNDDVQNAFASYDGLPHRMQQIAKIDHVLYINDSKATNAEASAPALGSFEHIYWIAGGLAKEGGIKTLHEYFGKIRKAYLIGEAAEDFAKTIKNAFPYSISHTLDKAVVAAANDAAKDQASEVAVVLSPACASYDQFKNYEARGDAFIEFVKQLKR